MRALNTRPGSGADRDLDLLPDSDERNVVLGNVRLEPHGGEVGDRVERLAGIVAHDIGPGPTLRAMTVPSIGAVIGVARLIVPFFCSIAISLLA